MTLSFTTDSGYVFLFITLYKSPYLDLGKNVVMWLGQCFSQELAN